MENNISMKEVVGGGYDDFWKSTKRYVVCKGSRASKKSTTAALKLICRLNAVGECAGSEANAGDAERFVLCAVAMGDKSARSREILEDDS